jgi:hypothetical protein
MLIAFRSPNTRNAESGIGYACSCYFSSGTSQQTVAVVEMCGVHSWSGVHMLQTQKVSHKPEYF